MKAVLTALALACAALAVPAVAPVHAAPAAATLPAPSRMVLDNSTRVIAALEKRRPEFNRNPAALRSFIASEFSQMFDKDYAARQVLGRHARGATDADVANFADALTNNLMQRYGSSLLAFNTRLTARVKSQSDLPRGQLSGLNEALGALEGVDGVTISRFAASDVVRHPLVGRIVEAYGKLDARKTAEG